jgi:acetaldehyde dehydrogenase (acetylating)
MGHTMSIHSQNDAVILEFGLHKPAYRICVNTPSTLGAIGFTTGLDPAMTLGCGGFGGNITSDNITPRHLINVKRVAYELRPAQPSRAGGAGQAGAEQPSTARPVDDAPRLPKKPGQPAPDAIPADALTSRIDRFLATRGLVPGSSLAAQPAAPPPPAEVEQFVCEDDVRSAVREGRKLLISERTIVTPAARDAGEAAKVFLHAGWPEV